MPDPLAVLACRLDEGVTWDEVLGVLNEMYIRYKLLRGACILELGPAAARLKRRLLVEPTSGGLTTIACPPITPDTNYKAVSHCAARCGACCRCLANDKVLHLDIARCVVAPSESAPMQMAWEEGAFETACFRPLDI